MMMKQERRHGVNNTNQAVATSRHREWGRHRRVARSPGWPPQWPTRADNRPALDEAVCVIDKEAFSTEHGAS